MCSKFRISVKPSAGCMLRFLEQCCIKKIRNAEHRIPMLAESPNFPMSPEPEILLRKEKSAFRRSDCLEPLRCELIRALLDEIAVRGCAPPSNPAPELVQLGKAKPVRTLDDHDSGVWHIDTDLDNARCHKHIERVRTGDL